MAAVTIRSLDEAVKERLRARAASHGRSIEAEARAIPAEAVSDPSDAEGLLVTLLNRFGEAGGVESELPSRTTSPRSPDFTA